MAYPAYYTRFTNFLQQVQAGGVWDQTTAAALDTELNNVLTSISAELAWVRNITAADNRLKNVAAATTLSLVATQRVVATALAQVVFDTTIPWDASMTTGSVLVNWIKAGEVVGEYIDVNQYAVATNAGNLRVTLTPTTVAVGDVMVITAYATGAGIQTRLASVAHGDGASMIGVEDTGGLYAVTTVEECLAEIRTAFNGLVTSLGTVADIWRRTGKTYDGSADAATGDWNMGGFGITNSKPGSAATDLATVGQVSASTQGLLNLVKYFLRKDVAVPWESDQDANSNKLANLIMTATDGATATEAANQSYVDAKIAAVNASIAAITSGGILTAPTGLRMQTFPTPGSGPSFNFTVPEGTSVVKAEVWGGGAGGTGYAGGAYGGGAGAYAMGHLTVVKDDVIAFAIGAGGIQGGSATSPGEDSVVYLNGVEVLRAKGGATDVTPATGPWCNGGVPAITANPKLASSLGITGGAGGYTPSTGHLAMGGQSPLGGGSQSAASATSTAHAPGGGGAYLFGFSVGNGADGMGKVTY